VVVLAGPLVEAPALSPAKVIQLVGGRRRAGVRQTYQSRLVSGEEREARNTRMPVGGVVRHPVQLA
jgi:hypothetical protein